MKSPTRKVWNWFSAKEAGELAVEAYTAACQEMAQVEREGLESGDPEAAPLGREDRAILALLFVDALIHRLGHLAQRRDIDCNHGCSLQELWWPSPGQNAAIFSGEILKGLPPLQKGGNNHG
ncbi:MAG TPA: hypothetical protein VFN09_05410 [Rhodanobacteraceae bacterium]|nr:hypothetical protein [Rhodanobacteraceae bacterium]